jgi:hypothetical protein
VPLGLLPRGRPAAGLQIHRHLFSFFPTHIVQAGPRHVHDAQLHRGLRIYRLDRLREALETVHAGDEDIFQAAVLQLRQHLQPELIDVFIRFGPALGRRVAHAIRREAAGDDQPGESPPASSPSGPGKHTPAW